MGNRNVFFNIVIDQMIELIAEVAFYKMDLINSFRK